MNIKSIITLLALLLWGWYSWSWLKEKQQSCGCALSAASTGTTILPLTYADKNNLPHSVTWQANQPAKAPVSSLSTESGNAQ